MAESKLVVPELGMIKVEGHTREAFLVRGTLAAGAVYGLSTVGPFVRQAFGQEGGGDVEILNFALTLEYLEAAFYAQALEQVGGLSRDVKDVADEIRKNEDEHVDALKAAIEGLGGTPVDAPGVDFGEAFASEDAFLELAQTFEDTGVSAYNGAAPEIEAKEVLGSAGAIVQVEARHAAVIRQIRGEDISPSAFDETLAMNEVLDAVKPFVR